MFWFPQMVPFRAPVPGVGKTAGGGCGGGQRRAELAVGLEFGFEPEPWTSGGSRMRGPFLGVDGCDLTVTGLNVSVIECWLRVVLGGVACSLVRGSSVKKFRFFLRVNPAPLLTRTHTHTHRPSSKRYYQTLNCPASQVWLACVESCKSSALQPIRPAIGANMGLSRILLVLGDLTGEPIHCRV